MLIQPVSLHRLNRSIVAGVFVFSTGLVVQADVAHPILAIPNVDNSIAKANTILSTWAEADYVASFIPTQAPRRDDAHFTDPVVSGDTSWSWSVSSPNQLTSKPSNTVFPGAAGYVQKTQTVTVLDGSSVAVPYYLAAGSTTRKSLVQAMIDFKKQEKLRADLLTLADAYMDSGATHATRNQAYARRIAVSLYEYGKYVPKYFMTKLNDPTLISGGVNFVVTENSHRCSARNGFGEELSTTELLAFDAIYDSPALATLGTELGLDVRAFIQTNLIENMGDFFVKHMTPVVGTYGNLPSASQVLSKMARVLDLKHYMPWLDGYFREMTENRVNRDGVLLEGGGYSINFIRTVRTAITFAQEYFLTWPADTPELQAVQANLDAYAAVLDQGIAQWELAALPNGRMASFGDLQHSYFFTKRNAGSSHLLEGYGHLSLGAGNTAATAVQLNQAFTGDANHVRSDMGGFVLYAHGQEVLENYRDSKEKVERQFTEQPIAHNMVTIDKADMSNRSVLTDGTGDLTLLEPGMDGIAVSEIDAQRIYSAKASRYQRIMLLNTTDIERPYAVDVFRVTGGTEHDYSLHGAMDYDSTASCSFPLNPIALTYPMLASTEQNWVAPTDHYQTFKYYGIFRNGSSATATQDFNITYAAVDADKPDLRLWMPNDGNPTVYLCRLPTPYREDSPSYVSFFNNGLWRPSTIIRKKAASGTLQSTFAAVVEAKKKENSGIVSVVKLPLTVGTLDASALRITFANGRIDTYLINHRNPDVNGANTGATNIATADGQYQLAGRVGLFSEGPDGAKVWSMNASEFRYPGGAFITPNLHYEGILIGETRVETGESANAFITATPLPLGTALQGNYLKLTFGTLSSPATAGISEMFQIDRVDQVGGQYHVVTTYDHQLNMTANGTDSIEQREPRRHFIGAHTFEINLSAGTSALPRMDDVAMTANTVSDAIVFTADETMEIVASSSNPLLIPDDHIILSTVGSTRSLYLMPKKDASGTATITLSTTDGSWTNSRSFQLTVTDPGAVMAVTNGSIFAGTTWQGGHVPVAGDAHRWKTGAFPLNINPSEGTFLGETFVISTGGTFSSGIPGTTLAMRNVVLDGGTLQHANNVAWNIGFGGNTFTLNGGTLRHSVGAGGRNIVFGNGRLAGNGTVTVNAGADTGSITFANTIDTTGFTGLFDIKANGKLALPSIPANHASFGLVLSGTGLYLNNAAIAVTSLTINGFALPDGIYTYSQFSPAQQALIGNNGGTITVGRPTGNTAPTLSSLPDQTIVEGETTPAQLFMIDDHESAASTLAVTATSDNPSLVPDDHILLGGTGDRRLIVINPALRQSGLATISVVVTDGSLGATNSFELVVTPYPVVVAEADGAVNSDAAWGRPQPTAGDTRAWQSGGHILTAAGATAFHGGTLVIQTNDELRTSGPGPVLPLNHLVLDGGTILNANNLAFVIDLTGDTLTLNGGTVKAGGSNNGRDIRFRNGSLAGSGTIAIEAGDATGSEVEFETTISTKGFIGIFEVKNNGILNLPPIGVANASFGLSISGTGRYWNDAAVALTSLLIDGETIPPGTYAYADFTATQRAFLVNNGGTITVVGPAPPPTAYEEWADGNNLAGDKTDDDDGDSLLNMAEYALGGNPTNPADRGHIPTVGIGSNWLDYVHVKRSAPNSGVTYTVEVADNLVAPNWTTNGVAIVGTGVLDATFDTVTNRISIEIKTNQFIRLIVEYTEGNR